MHTRLETVKTCIFSNFADSFLLCKWALFPDEIQHTSIMLKSHVPHFYPELHLTFIIFRNLSSLDLGAIAFLGGQCSSSDPNKMADFSERKYWPFTNECEHSTTLQPSRREDGGAHQQTC